MFGSGSRKDRHRPPPMPEFDPTKPQYNSTPVIPIPPYLIAPNGFPPTNNVIPNPHPHSSTRRQLPPSRTGSFPSFPNSSPYSDSNTNPYDSDGPPVIPVSDGNGGYVLAAGFNPDGTVIPQPPQQQPQSMGGRHGQWAPPGPSTTHPYPPLYPAQAPPTRPSRATASGPSPWQPPMGPPPPYSSPYAVPAPHGPPPPPPKHNTTEMTRENLLAVLNHFSEMLEDYFDFEPLSSMNPGPGNGNGEGNSSSSNRPPSRPFSLQMAVHGGACMLLHQGLYSLSLNLPLGEQSSQSQQPTDPHGHYNSNGEKPPHMSQLTRRTTTRDVDIIFRCFVADYGGLGPPPNPGERARRNPSYPGEGQPNDPNPDSPTRVSHMDAASRMKACIRNTTRAFPGLGLDWMNADADVALPLATDPQTAQPFDPLHRSTFTAHNESVFTIYTSPNRRLTLVGVPPYWAIALKIARWGKRDWADVGILLRAGTILSGTRWTEDMLMEWLKKNCWAMGYSVWEARRIHEMKEKIHDAIEMIQGWEPGSPSHYPQPARPQLHAQAQAQAQERPTERGRDMTSRQQNAQDWGSTAQKKKSKSRARSRARQRSLSTGPTEIFIPTEEDEYDAEYGGGYQDRDFEPRGRAHHRHHHSFHNQLMHPPPASHAPPPHSHSHGAPSGPLSQSTAIAPFFPQPQNHPGGSQNTRAWRRQTSRSRNRDNKKGKKAKQRDKQRRLEHQRREDRRSEWNMPPTDSESETESEESEEDSSEDDDEEDKENRDRRRAWIRENIYGPSKKRPTPLNLPNTFPPPPQGPAPAPAPPPFNPFVDQQRPPAMPQPQLQPHSRNSRQPSPFRRPPSPGEPPMDAGPAALAQYQFERQMLSLESERRREKQFRETIGRVAGRVMARANRGG